MNLMEAYKVKPKASYEKKKTSAFKLDLKWL